MPVQQIDPYTGETIPIFQTPSPAPAPTGASGGGGPAPGPGPTAGPGGGGVQVGSGLSPAEIAARIKNDPTYLYEYDRLFGPKGYYTILAQHDAQDLAAIGGGGGGGGYIPDYTKLRELAKKQAGQQKDEASRDAAIQQVFNRERRASMGQGAGQTGTGVVEEDNDAKELEFLLSQIDIGLETQMEQYRMSEQSARAAAANAAAASARAAANAQLAIQQRQDLRNWDIEGKKNDLLAASAGRVMDLLWDENTGVYRGPNGVTYTSTELANFMGGQGL